MFMSLELYPKNTSQLYRENRYRPIHQAWVNRREQHIIQKLLISYGLQKSSILDAPCGYGRLFPVYEYLDMPITGVDINPIMVQFASEYSDLGYDMRVLNGDMLHLPFKDKSFDVILCMRLFHHQLDYNQRQTILSELSRVTRHYIIISYYKFAWLHALSCLLRWRSKCRVPTLLKEAEIGVLFEMNKLHLLSTCYVLRHAHMQTLAILEKY